MHARHVVIGEGWQVEQEGRQEDADGSHFTKWKRTRMEAL
jgi:hypothetical protein